jgi:hypothetical protein
MLMPMVNVRIVRVEVKHLAMYVQVAVSPMGMGGFIMVMLVMLVMHVAVIVLEDSVSVLVSMALGKV